MDKQKIKQAREGLQQAGISMVDYAKANGFTYDIVKSVLFGRSKCTRGESHKVAVALGIKPAIVANPKGFNPLAKSNQHIN